jgi:fluoride ion exporter CrcB/FEX
MQKQKPIIETSLSERADERERSDGQRFMTKVAGALVNLGLVVSAVLTNIYLMLLVDEATTLPDPYGLLFGFLVGIVAIVPAELALIVWRERLAGDAKITSGQRATAVTALFLAGIFSALTTSSFFSYFLPQLFSPNYIAIAPALNVAAIVGSWIVFIMAIVFYSITSRETKQNLSQAKAQQSMFDARISVLKAAAEAIRTDAEATINVMEQGGVFSQDARRLIIASLGMDEERLRGLPEPTTTLATANQQRPQQPTAPAEQPPAPKPEPKPEPVQPAHIGPIEDGPIRPTPRPMPNGQAHASQG